jgi:hypothetical protein
MFPQVYLTLVVVPILIEILSVPGLLTLHPPTQENTIAKT